jgi:hypothetical protein
MRLLRQEQPGDWEGVFGRIGAAVWRRVGRRFHGLYHDEGGDALAATRRSRLGPILFFVDASILVPTATRNDSSQDEHGHEVEQSLHWNRAKRPSRSLKAAAQRA